MTGRWSIASEYVAGGSLADWLAQHGGKAPSVEAAVSMMRGILAGLEHLHQNDLIHRDLKPDNVLLQASTPRLTDFGLTRVLKPSGHTTNMAGTPGYMAPEAFQGHYSPPRMCGRPGCCCTNCSPARCPILRRTSTPCCSRSPASSLLRSPTRFPSAAPGPRKGAGKACRATLRFRCGDGRGASGGADSLRGKRHALLSQAATQPSRTDDLLHRQGKEIGEVKTLLAKTRLLTLTGSRRAAARRGCCLQAAAEVLEDYAEGVWLVELAPLADPALVPQAVATALGVRRSRASR